MPHNAGMPSPLLLPVLACAGVLLVSGVAKLRDRASVDRAFTSLEVPAPLSGPLVRRAVPWAEVVLGLWLVVAGGAVLAVGAAVTVVLFLVYLALVARAVGRPEPADCGCFGALGDDRVTRVTVWRNVVLVVAAVLALVAGLRGEGVLASLGVAATWAWLAATVLVVAVAVLVTHRSPSATDAGHADGASLVRNDEDGEYVRDPIPHAQVQTEDGDLVLLTQQTDHGAMLLVFLSPGCGPCARIGPLVPGWAEELAPILVRGVVTGPKESLLPGLGLDHLSGHSYLDPYAVTRRAFGVSAPGAVLLGTDGYLAGGPVQGEEDVLAFVDELREHLRAAQPAAGDPAGA